MIITKAFSVIIPPSKYTSSNKCSACERIFRHENFHSRFTFSFYFYGKAQYFAKNKMRWANMYYCKTASFGLNKDKTAETQAEHVSVINSGHTGDTDRQRNFPKKCVQYGAFPYFLWQQVATANEQSVAQCIHSTFSAHKQGNLMITTKAKWQQQQQHAKTKWKALLAFV